MGFNQLPNGDWYYFNPRTRSCDLLVKNAATGVKYIKGYVAGNLVAPKVLIGKRCRLKLELIDEE